jgi:hypothetical protein
VKQILALRHLLLPPLPSLPPPPLLLLPPLPSLLLLLLLAFAGRCA